MSTKYKMRLMNDNHSVLSALYPVNFCFLLGWNSVRHSMILRTKEGCSFCVPLCNFMGVEMSKLTFKKRQSLSYGFLN